jgi:hypothetical protein
MLIPNRFEALHQIPRGFDFDAALANRLDRARVDPRDIRDRAFPRVFHSHTPHAAQEPRQLCFKLLTSRVSGFLSWQRVERTPLNRVNQSLWFARHGHQIEPAARRHFAAVCGAQQP